jgi:hypothetical protein
MAKKKTIRTWLSEAFIHNFTAKLMALAMAVALWFYAFSFSQIVRDSKDPIFVPVDPPTVPEGWVAELNSRKIEMTASYPRRNETDVEQAVRDGLIRVRVRVDPDESGPDEQTLTVPLGESTLDAPRGLGIQPIRFEPSELAVKVISETTVNVRVTPDISPPPPGYQVAYIYPQTVTIKVRGRKDIVSNLQNTGMKTETIDISTNPPPRNTIEWTIPATARIPSEIENNGTPHPIRTVDSVPFRIVLMQVSAEKSFSGIPIYILLPPDFRYTATLLGERTVDVIVQGPQELLDSVTPDNITVSADLKNQGPNEVPYTPHLEMYISDDLPRADELTVRPADPVNRSGCSVRVSERPPA